MTDETPVRILDINTAAMTPAPVPAPIIPAAAVSATPAPSTTVAPHAAAAPSTMAAQMAPGGVTNKQQIEHALDVWFNQHFRGPMMAGASDFWVIAQGARQGLSSIVKGI